MGWIVRSCLTSDADIVTNYLEGGFEPILVIYENALKDKNSKRKIYFRKWIANDTEPLFPPPFSVLYDLLLKLIELSQPVVAQVEDNAYANSVEIKSIPQVEDRQVISINGEDREISVPEELTKFKNEIDIGGKRLDFDPLDKTVDPQSGEQYKILDEVPDIPSQQPNDSQNQVIERIKERYGNITRKPMEGDECIVLADRFIFKIKPDGTYATFDSGSNTSAIV